MDEIKEVKLKSLAKITSVFVKVLRWAFKENSFMVK